MRSGIRSIYRIMTLALLLGSFVFVGTAKAELAEAKAKLKSDLAKIDEKAKEQARARAGQSAKIERDYKTNKAKVEAEYKAAMKKIRKRRKDAGVDGLGALFADKKKAAIIKSINKEEARIKAEYKEAKAKVEADYKLAKSELNARAKTEAKELKDEKVKAEKDYKQKVAEMNSRAKARKAAAKAKAKAELEARKRAEAEKKKKAKAEREKAKAEAKAKAAGEKRAKAEAKAKAKAEVAAKKRAEAEKKKKERAEREKAKAELAAAGTKKKSDLADVDRKAKGQAKARAEEKKRIEKVHKDAVAKIESEYRAAKKEVEKRAKEAGVDGLGALFADKKKAAILKSINKDKARIEAEYEDAKAKAKAQYNRSIAALDSKTKSQKKEIALEKATIAKEYESKKSEINLKLNAEKIAAKAKAEEEKKAKAQAKAKAKAEAAAKKRAEAEKKKRERVERERAKAKAKAEALAKRKAEEEQKKQIKTARKKAKAEEEAELAKAEREKKLKLLQLQAKARADTRAIAEEGAEVEKDYKSAMAKAKYQYKKAKKQEAAAEAKSKSELAEAKARTEAELAEAQKKMKSNLAEVAKKTRMQAKARAEEKKRIEKVHKDAIAKAGAEYKAANKKIEKRAKDAGVDGLKALFADKKKAAILKSINEDKAKIKAEYENAKAKAKAQYNRSITASDSETKSQTKEIAREKAKIANDYKKTKSEIGLKLKAKEPKVPKPKPIAEEKPAGKIEYEQALAKIEAEYKKEKSDLKEKKKLVIEKKAKEKTQIETGYEEAVAKANLKFQYEDAKVRCGLVGPIEDDSQKFLVREIKISGNTLISTADLLEGMPAIYITSNPKGNPGKKEMYDFRVLHEIILEPGEPREVSKNTIQGFTRYILSRYQERRYAGIYVYVSAKAVKGAAELEDEILPIQILEGRVAKITIDRYDLDRQKTEKEVLKSSVLKSWSPVRKGQVIKRKELDDFVNLLNLNPDRYVSAVISKGDEPGTINLGYDVYEANPWHWFVQLDNAGTDERQWNPRVGVLNTDLTGRDDRFSFMYQAPPDGLDENYLLFGNYEAPFFTPRLRLGFYAGYSQFEITPEAGGGIVNFRGNGSFYGGTLRYNVLQVADWFFDFLGSLSHERSKVTPSLGIATDIDMDLFGVGGELHRSDNMSSTSLSFNRVESFEASSQADFTMSRLNSDPDFTIYTLSASHRQFLDESKIHELSGSFRSITSDHRLVPAKMTTFGGLYSVRGYQEDEIVADGGILASLQYRFDLTKYLEEDESGNTEKQSSYKKKAWPPDVSLLGFVDHGRAKVKDPVPGEDRAQDLLGIGLGTAVELGNNAYGAVYYSWPLRSTADTGEGEGRWNFNFIMRW